MPRTSTAKVIAIKELMDKRKGSISVCMIARDEEGCIGEALRSVKDLADEMIVVDTGSRDGTILEARECGARVYEIPWNNDFIEARNVALSKATKEWILVLDADEAIAPADHEKIRALVLDGRNSAFLFEQRTYTNGSTGPCAEPVSCPDDMARGSDACFGDMQIRLFRNNSSLRYACEIHENVEESLLMTGTPVRESDIVIHHYGRIEETTHADRPARADQLARVHRKALIWGALDRKGMPAYPANPRYLYEMAAQFLALGRVEDAVSHARTGLEFEPKSWHFWNVAGLAHLRGGDSEKALACFRNGIYLADDSPELLNNMGAALMESKEPAEALIHFERAIGLEGNNPDILRNAASACALTGELENGLEYINRSLALDQFAAHSHAIHADILFRMDDFAGAAQVLEKMRFLPDTPFRIYLKVIQLYTRMQMMEEAEQVVGAAIDEFPDQENLWYLAGKISELRGANERAISLYRRVLAANPCHADALNSLGCVYDRRGQLDDALTAFRHALRGKPHDTQLEVNIGIVLDKLGRLEEAGRHLARAMENGERSGFAYNALGCHLARSDKFDEALVYFTKAIELESSNATYYQNLGFACEKMNLLTKAAEVYEKMTAIDPRTAPFAQERLMRIGEPMARET